MTLRPAELIRLFWMEQIVIEEQARFLEPVYFFEVQNETKGANNHGR